MQFGTQHLWYAMCFNLHAAPSNDPLVQKCSLLKVGLQEQYYATAEPGPIYLSLIRLRPSSPGRSVGGAEKKGELAITPLEFEFHLQFPCGSPLPELSDFPQSEGSGKECECKQLLKNTCQG